MVNEIPIAMIQNQPKKFSRGSPSRSNPSLLLPPVEGNSSMQGPSKASSIDGTPLAGLQGSASTYPLGTEAWDYLYDSLFKMVDPQICNNDIMSVEDALLEIAMFEKIKLQQAKQDKKSN